MNGATSRSAAAAKPSSQSKEIDAIPTRSPDSVTQPNEAGPHVYRCHSYSCRGNNGWFVLSSCPPPRLFVGRGLDVGCTRDPATWHTHILVCSYAAIVWRRASGYVPSRPCRRFHTWSFTYVVSCFQFQRTFSGGGGLRLANRIRSLSAASHAAWRSASRARAAASSRRSFARRGPAENTVWTRRSGLCEPTVAGALSTTGCRSGLPHSLSLRVGRHSSHLLL